MDWLLALANEHPSLGWLWFLWVTFHDPVQWTVMAILGLTVWGQRRRAKEQEAQKIKITEAVREEVAHIHQELHHHILEDKGLHESLGQTGMSEGT